MGFLEKIALTGIAFLLLGGFEESLGRIGFKKDQKTTLEFPPRLVDTIAGIPQGHLRPLGKHATLINLNNQLIDIFRPVGGHH